MAGPVKFLVFRVQCVFYTLSTAHFRPVPLPLCRALGWAAQGFRLAAPPLPLSPAHSSRPHSLPPLRCARQNRCAFFPLPSPFPLHWSSVSGMSNAWFSQSCSLCRVSFPTPSHLPHTRSACCVPPPDFAQPALAAAEKGLGRPACVRALRLLSLAAWSPQHSLPSGLVNFTVLSFHLNVNSGLEGMFCLF